MLCIFFFTQKTAYEMRISDWSSDVCSSDLVAYRDHADGRHRAADRAALRDARSRGCHAALSVAVAADLARQSGRRRRPCRIRAGRGGGGMAARLRSEEHTSELQSLMRISYAVFCLKKKKTPQYNQHTLN